MAHVTSRTTKGLVRPSARGALAFAVTLALILVGGGLQLMAQEDLSDTISIVKEDETPSNAEVTVRLSEATFDGTGTVLLGRDDEFADAMASSVLQSGAPLLLTPPAGPLPQRVRSEILRQGAERVILLGGPQALSDAVAEEVAGLVPTVQRREGLSRFETAIDIAATDAPDARTVILARAFSSDPDDPTQAFADSIAAGGLSAAEGYPILLTQTEVLTGATRDYLSGSPVTDVLIVGGTAAVSEAVEGELGSMGLQVERIAGSGRAETAVDLAGKRGADSAADVARTILVDGESADAWAGGFAAAAHSARFGAPVLLARADGLPAATEEWLSGGASSSAFAQSDSPDPVLTCVTIPSVCEEARVALGLPDPVTVTPRPRDGSEVEQGVVVDITITGESLDGVTVAYSGVCVASGSATLGSDGRAAVQIPMDAPLGDCTVTWSITLGENSVQTLDVGYVVITRPPPPPSPRPSPPPPTGFPSNSP